MNYRKWSCEWSYDKLSRPFKTNVSQSVHLITAALWYYVFARRPSVLAGKILSEALWRLPSLRQNMKKRDKPSALFCQALMMTENIWAPPRGGCMFPRSLNLFGFYPLFPITKTPCSQKWSQQSSQEFPCSLKIIWKYPLFPENKCYSSRVP